MPDIFVATKNKKDQGEPKGDQERIAKEQEVTGDKKDREGIKVKEPEKKSGRASHHLLQTLKEVTTNPLAAFMANPPNLRFETQESEEKAVLLLRRHFITNLGWILLGAVLFVAPPFVFPLLPLEFLPDRFDLIILLTWYLATFAYVFTRFIGWFFNVNIITDERIIDIDFPTLLFKDITEAKIDQVQDVNMKVGGFARSLFNFGDVLIQTASAVPEIRFEAVPDPERVAKVINELKLQEEQEKIEGRVR